MKPGFLIDLLLDVILPRYCLSCGVPVEVPGLGYVCATCRGKVVPVMPAACDRCAAPVGLYDDTADGCFLCRKRRFAFETARVAVAYRGVVRDLVTQFKYRRERVLDPWFAETICGRLDAGWPTDLIVPVPLCERSYARRGFNQSEVLADMVARTLKKPVRPDLLVRVRETPPQAGASFAERTRQLKDAFAARGKKIVGARVLLVDDVLTTGSTANECARALKKAGAQTVGVFAFARTVGKD